MKKIYYFRFLAVFILLLALGTNTRAQNTCNIAASMPSSPCFELQFQDNQDYWIQFTADSTTYMFKNEIASGAAANVTDLYLYSGTCGNLQLKYHESRTFGDSLMLYAHHLTVNAVYYLRVHQANPTSNYFKLCVKKYTLKEWVPGDCPPPWVCTNTKDLISNGGFEPTPDYVDGYDDPFNNSQLQGTVCGWEKGWGSPNLLPSVSSSNYYASIHSAIIGGHVEGEALLQSFADANNAPQQNRKYTLTFKYNTTAPVKLYVYLTNLLFMQNSNVGTEPQPNFTSYYPLIDGITVNSSQWQTQTVCISNLPMKYLRLLIFIRNETDGTHRFLNIDDVSLIENSFSIDTPNPIVCNGSEQINTYPCPLNVPGVNWNFNWSNGQHTQNITVSPTQTTTYTVTATNECFSFTQQATVTVTQPVTPVFTGDETTCNLTSTYTVSNYAPGANEYWAYGFMVNGQFNQIGLLSTSNQFTINWNTYPNGGVLTVIHYYGNHLCETSASMTVYPCCKIGTVYNDATITGIEHNHHDISVNGTLTIDPGAELGQYNYTIYMGANAKIVLLDDGVQNTNLYLFRCSIKACNTVMWDGIYTNSPNSKVTFDQCVVVQDAKKALVSGQGGNYEIIGSLFDKNYVDVMVQRYPGTHPGSIAGSTFDCSGVLLPQDPAVANSDKTWRHIVVNNVGTLNIGNSNYPTAYANTFRNGRMGIAIQNSGVNIIHNNFENFVEYPLFGEPNGYAIYARNNPKAISNVVPYLYVGEDNVNEITTNSNIFSKCTYGVYAYNIHIFKIRNNIFSNAALTPASYYRGIGVVIDELMPKSSVLKNISENTMSNLNIGISLNNVSTACVDHNTITNMLVGNASHACGIYSMASSANSLVNNIIYNPSVTLNTYGIKQQSSFSKIVGNNISRMQHGIYVSGGAQPSTVHLNVLFYNNFNIHLKNGAVIGPQGNPPTNPLDTWKPQDNQFFHNAGQVDLYTSGNTDGSQSPFFYKGTQPTRACAPDGSSLIGLNYLPSGNCTTSSACMSNFRTASIDELMEKISQEEINYAEYDPETKEITKYAVYRDLKSSDTSNLLGDLKIFYDEKSLGDYGKLEDVMKYTDDGDLQAAINKLNTVSNDETTISLIKELYGLLLETEIDSLTFNYKFDENQLQYMRNLAGECPYKFGKAVYMARSVLRTIDSTLYRNECEQEEINMHQRSMQASRPQLTECKIYPNPTNGELYIDINSDAAVQIEMYNYLGKTVYAEKADGRQNVINTSNLAGGVYTVKLLVEGNSIYTEKLTIIK